jgi:nicotinamidase-related amidase
MARIRLFRGILGAVLTAASLTAFSLAASAQGVVSEWKTVEAPPPPDLVAVKVDVPTTALMVMDFTQAACNPQGERPNPRCIAALPKIKQLLAEARTHHMYVIFTSGPTKAPNTKEVPPLDSEPMLAGPPNKFDGANELDKLLKDHGIKNLILMGTAPNGALLFTAYGAAVHGYKVIVPVDTMPGSSPYAEASSIWGVGHDPTVANASTLTTVDMITF